VEGVRTINEAVRNGWRVASFIYSGEWALCSLARGVLADTATEVNFELTDSLMEALSRKEETSELLAVVKMRDAGGESIPLSENPLLMLFDRPSNNGNLGTVLRSCDAMGADGLIITGHAVDIYDPDVVSSSMGSFFRVPFIRLTDQRGIDAYIGGLRERFPALMVIGTTAHAQARVQDVDMTSPVLLLVGNETDGLNRYFADMCDIMATIPMSAGSSASSLNVGCAATVLLYEAARQRAE
jgi:TrmH family RNA methyltransferase